MKADVDPSRLSSARALLPLCGSADRLGCRRRVRCWDGDAARSGEKSGRRSGRAGMPSANQMREKLLSIGDDSWIEDESGRRAFKVNGKALRLRKTLIIEDPSGVPIVQIQDRPLRVRDVMEIEDSAGATVATVAKGVFALLPVEALAPPEAARVVSIITATDLLFTMGRPLSLMQLGVLERHREPSGGLPGGCGARLGSAARVPRPDTG